MGTRVILIRHGQSTYNALGLYQGCCDESILTETGHQTARETGAFLREIKFDAVYTSPLKRAQETTGQILEAMKYGVNPQQIHVVPLLRETDLPSWQGISFQQVRQQFATEYLLWKQKPHQLAMEIVREGVKQNFYPALDLYKRLRQFWQEVLPRHNNQTLLIVAHGGTNRAAIATALGISPYHYHTIQQSNCAVNILHFPNGELSSAQLEAVNLISDGKEILPQPQEGGKGLRLLLIPSQDTQLNQDRKLTALLDGVSIQFSLSNYPLTKILERHPETVQLQVLRQDFTEIWQQTLLQKRNCNGLTTGLVLASSEAIASLLSQVIGMEKSQSWRLQLQPETISVIQYPATDHPPILQAMNIFSLKHLILDKSLNQVFAPQASRGYGEETSLGEHSLSPNLGEK